MINATYRPSMTLLTDLYQLTMGYGYWRHGIHQRRAVFHLFFRACPFAGQYAIAAGLGPAIEWLQTFRVTTDDIDFLRSLQGNNEQRLFSDEFLLAIDGMRLEIDVDAVPEGTMAFPHAPIMRVTGPLWQCQWVESALLNVINFQTLIATKASRICHVVDATDSVLEFGLRRAQGIDGALSASRAAFIGGCGATSNVLAGKLLGIPVKGTHAHSWVMAFDDELASFQAYADAMPNNCVFLVDTYDTIEGVNNAITVGHQLRDTGYRMVGIRLDSGDLAELSLQARRMLDEAGFKDAAIVASNDLDEFKIQSLKQRGAKIAVWGVGTNLVTAKDQPALGGVYKLAAIEDERGDWQPRIKLSERAIKTSIPGILQVRRYFQDHVMLGDVIFSELLREPVSADGRLAIHSIDGGQEISLDAATSQQDLLMPVLRGGELVAPMPPLNQIRRHASDGYATLPKEITALSGCKRPYSVGLETRLAEQRQSMIQRG